MTCAGIIEALKAQANPENVAGMARYGISPVGTLGVSLPFLRRLAKEIGRRHDLAEELWRTGIHEARILASLIDDPGEVTEDQMERWAADVDSWDVCDQLCNNLFSRTGFAYAKAAAWSGRPETFIKRAGFVLMAQIAVHDKKADDVRIAAFLPLIVGGSVDNRSIVKKAVNWALRQIGKRNPNLNSLAIDTARQIRETGTASARWIATDAIRELTGTKVRSRWEMGRTGPRSTRE